MLNPMQKPLKVALLSISPHNRAILEFFFAGAGKQIFNTVDAEQAEAFIVDFDHPGGKQEWHNQTAMDFKPAIVLSVKETAEDNMIWVSKPLTSKALLGAADEVRKLMPAPEVASRVQTAGQQVQDAEHSESIASLRALLDTQAKDAQPFGVSRQHIRKAPPVAPAALGGIVADTLVRPTSEAAAEQAEVAGGAEAEIPVLQTAADSGSTTGKAAVEMGEDSEHHLRTEDVYIPPPLADETVVETDRSFGSDGTDQIDDPIKLEQRWNRLCGHEKEVSADNWHESNALYTPENYLLNQLVDALKLSHQSKQYVQMKIDTDDYALLMPDVNLVYCSMAPGSDQFSKLCDIPLKTGRVQLHLPSTTELATLEETVQRDAQHTYDMEALIWTTSLLTSRGRLNRNAELTQSLRLKHWPNLTRLEQFPHIMQIASVWQQRAGTVFDVSEWLDIPQRYVIAFYNAAHTLSLFAVEQAKPQRQEKPAPVKNRGLFSRLLKRLLGGGAK